MSSYNQSPRRRTQDQTRTTRDRQAYSSQARTSARADRTARTAGSSRTGRGSAGGGSGSGQGGFSGLVDRATSQDGPQYLLITALVAIVVLALIVFTSVSSCAKGGGKAQPQEEASPYNALYDWDGLSTETDRYTYVVDDQVVSRLGVDVSEAQGDIDWAAVAKDGIDFAIVRVGYRGNTEGEVYTDANFDANIDGAIDAGLDVGAYFYSQALTEDEAREEAQRCLYEINGRKLQYPVVFDFEYSVAQEARGNDIDAGQAAANAKAFCQEIEDGGYKASIYGNPNDLAHYNLSAISGYPLWYAEYGSLPTADYQIALWQYTNQGKVAGIDTIVDLNLDMQKVPVLPQEEAAETK